MAQLWFKFWAKEYLADSKIRSLTYEQRGILQTLWGFAWDEGSIPADPILQSRMLGLHSNAMRTHSEWINKFFVPDPRDPSNLLSPRLELDRAEADSRGAKARESALHRWNKHHAKALPSECEVPSEPHAGQGQGQGKEENKTPTPSPEAPVEAPKGKQKREPKPKKIGGYPPEVYEAREVWRDLVQKLRSREILIKFQEDPEAQYVAQVGTLGKTWMAWQKRMGVSTPNGVVITHKHILAAVRIWADTRYARAKAGKRLSSPNLSSQIGSPDFDDALLHVVEEAHAS